MVEMIGEPVAFVVVNEGVFPVPLAARPISVFEFVHAKVAPATGELNAEAATVLPAQAVTFVIAFTVGVGLTVRV